MHDNAVAIVEALHPLICNTTRSYPADALGEKTKHKQIQRWKHQQLIDEYNAGMKSEASKAIIKKSAAIAEHPFGTIKRMLEFTLGHL